MIKTIFMPMLKRAAKPYVAGDTIDDALRIADTATSHGYGVTICYWQADEDPPEKTADGYIACLDRIAKEGIDAHIAVKVPALRERQDLISKVITVAREVKIPVDFDSHSVDNAEANYAAAEQLPTDMLGCVIPGRWRRSENDAERAVKLGLRVRVVKGNWADPHEPEKDLRLGYLEIIDRLAGRCREVGVATHNPYIARESFKRLQRTNTKCVQELLYGLPIEPVAAEGRAAGVPTRIYIPFGEAWFPYSLSQAMNRPETFYWLAKDMLRGRAPGVPAPGG